MPFKWVKLYRYDKACASLRCTSCDFDVISFDDVGWDEGTDAGIGDGGVEYMFFRNNYPRLGCTR